LTTNYLVCKFGLARVSAIWAEVDFILEILSFTVLLVLTF